MTIDMQTAVDSLVKSELCPACGGKKKKRQSFCYSDYRALPKELRDRLWDGVGNGYEEAVAEALKFLEVKEPHWPPKSPS